MLLFGQGILSTLDNMHSVVKGETWESIAASYGVLLEELRSANLDVKSDKLKKGTLLIIPKVFPPSPKAIPNSSLPVAAETYAPSLIRTAIPNLKVGVLLPLTDKRMIEFYRGLLMAADSVRKSGVNLDIYAWDSGTTMTKVEPILQKLGELDILFGPALAVQLQPVAETCREQGVRLVLPFFSGQPLEDYPLVYNATAPSSILYAAAAKKMLTYYADKNYVIVHSGDADNKGNNLAEAFTKSVTQRIGTPKTLDINGDDSAYESALNISGNNMLILDDSNVRSLNIFLSRLKDFRRTHPQYRLSLIGCTDWLDETQSLLPDFFAFDTYIISPFYYNMLDDKARQFEQTYMKNFGTSMQRNNPRFAVHGFDLGYYFLTGISSLGDTFEQMQGSIKQEPYQNWYRFERCASALSFSNNFVQFVHYTSENKIELIR